MAAMSIAQSHGNTKTKSKVIPKPPETAKRKKGPAQAGPGDKTKKVTYLRVDEIEEIVVEPNQALAESQGTFKAKVATFNMGSRQEVKKANKKKELGRLRGRGSLF